PRAEGGAVGDAIQPVAQQFAPLQGRCLAGQHEEGRLESILRIALVVQDAATDAEHERSVASQQGLEGFLLAADDESLQQLSICQRVVRYCTQAAHDLTDPAARHRAPPGEAPHLPHGTARSRTVSYTSF